MYVNILLKTDLSKNWYSDLTQFQERDRGSLKPSQLSTWVSMTKNQEFKMTGAWIHTLGGKCVEF